ncbi:phosphoinositide phospholipase C [Trichonephila clavata]|uniref:Phosphoinositide phospholipase C n=1 Tax=Trichonephila clavata TaxID=2740835 RepID=A0A8X6HDG2_TRICU|nr:phosphoinositide phospholipase C [Trichonephila clavata]
MANMNNISGFKQDSLVVVAAVDSPFMLYCNIFKVLRDPDAMDEHKVGKFMREYLQDPFRDVHEPFFTVPEFLDFLFSKQNDAWDSKHIEVNQDMHQPLVNYWIASSHNT